MDIAVVVKDDGKKQSAAAMTEEPREEDGINQDALTIIIEKMDAQFLEIKETLYFRKVRDAYEVPPPSRLVSGPPTKSSSIVSDNGTKGNGVVDPVALPRESQTTISSAVAPGGNQGNTKKVHPAPRTTDNADSSTKSSSGARGIVPIVSLKRTVSKIKSKQRIARPQPPRISNLYDKQLETVSGSFSEKEFTGHKHKCCFPCCCGRDRELDQFMRDSLWQSCSPPVYYWLLFTGVIPTSRVPWLLPLIWCFFIFAKIVLVCSSALTMYEDLKCNQLDEDCTSATRGFAQEGTSIFYSIFHIVSMSTNLFILTNLLQSREVRCLLSYVGHPRVRGSKTHNIILVASVILLITLGSLQVLVGASQYQYSQGDGVMAGLIIIVVAEVPVGIACYSTGFVFWVMFNAITICYADFAVDVLEEANQPLHLYSPGGNSEIILMNQFKRIVSLSAHATKRTRVALFLSLIPGFMFIFLLASFRINIQVLVGASIFYLYKVIVPAFLPVLLAFLATREGDMLERLVTLSQFLNLAVFVRNNPSEWMLTQRTPISFALLGKITGAVVVLGALSSSLYQATSALDESPFWAPQHSHVGSCDDGRWTGFEQHVDCGGPRSGCPSTCVEKYGQYLFIEATRDCSDIDGYVEIRTQRACEIAYASFQRNRTNASVSTPIPAYIRLSAGSNTDLANVSVANLRCGTSTGHEMHATNINHEDGTRMVIFPALLSADALDLASATMNMWRSSDEDNFNRLVDKAGGKHFAASVLCVKRAGTCSSKRPNDWSEALACNSEPAPASNVSWTVASEPWAYKTSTNILTSVVTYKEPASVTIQGDCAHVKVNTDSSPHGVHVVLDVPCSPERRCNVATRVRSQDCSKVSALISVLDATGRHENERRKLTALCGLQDMIVASRGDHVHIIADDKSGPFEIDLCV